jgi:hypothetical protein
VKQPGRAVLVKQPGRAVLVKQPGGVCTGLGARVSKAAVCFVRVAYHSCDLALSSNWSIICHVILLMALSILQELHEALTRLWRCTLARHTAATHLPWLKNVPGPLAQFSPVAPSGGSSRYSQQCLRICCFGTIQSSCSKWVLQISHIAQQCFRTC